MTYSEKIMLAVVIVTAVLLWTGECRAEEYKLHLNLLPVSQHIGETDATNERHKGVGLTFVSPTGVGYGFMRYKNSFGHDGQLISISKRMLNCTICPGIGAGYAPAYIKSYHLPYLAWVSLSYKWVSILYVPEEVAALMFSVPLH